MIEDIIIPLAVIAAAEFGDKTQISILLLSSRSKKHLQILFGVILAFLIVDGVAIVAGSWITTLVDIKILKIISGVVFIVFGIFMLLNRKEEEKDKKYDKNAFISAFLLIFLTEWGDKTQIAAALFATQYNALLVLIGTMLALTSLSLIAIFFGKIVSERINKKLINKIAGIVFIILGITFFLI
jgi:putative Ca2+/H+ antiporter (TMEM165/GDT1 family)